MSTYLKTLLTWLLNKFPKNILIILVLIFFGLWGRSVYKNVNNWVEADAKWKIDVVTRQRRIETGVRAGFKENEILHKELKTDLEEVKQKQGVVVNTLSISDKKLIDQVHKDFERQRQMFEEQIKQDEEKVELGKSSPNSYIVPIKSEFDNILISKVESSLQDTVKKNSDFFTE